MSFRRGARVRWGPLVAAACFGVHGICLGETNAAMVAHIDARGAGFEESARFEAEQQLSVGTEVRGSLAFDGFPLAYLAGIGYQFGASRPLGFLYDAYLMPLGFGADFGETGFVGVLGGARLSGVTSRVPLSGAALAELRAELALGAGLLASLWFAPSWEGNEGRRGGAPSLEPVDEFSAGLAVRLGEVERGWQGRGSAGLFVGALYLERGEARGAGIVVGHGLSLFGGGF